MKDPRNTLADGLEDRAERLEHLAENAEEEPWYRAHITFGLFVVAPLTIVLGGISLPDPLGAVMVVGGVVFLLGLLRIYPDVRRARREAAEQGE